MVYTLESLNDSNWNAEQEAFCLIYFNNIHLNFLNLKFAHRKHCTHKEKHHNQSQARHLANFNHSLTYLQSIISFLHICRTQISISS